MRKSTAFWAVVLILFGSLLLLETVGILQFSVWGLFWPLLLIALGLWVLWGFYFGRRSIETEEVTIPLEGAEQARVRIRHGAGRLHVNAGTNPGELISGTFGGGLDRRVRREGDTLEVEMRVPPQGFALPWMGWPGGSLDWLFGLNREVSLALDVETGASDTRLDLTDLHVTDLQLKTGASAMHLTLPAHAGHTQARISSGVAGVNVRVPPGVAARIRVQSGLAGVHVDRSRFPRAGGVYQSPNYDTATNKAEIRVETGVGSVDVG